MEFKNKRVVVTGGSSGIGLELARALVMRGASVFITGRRREVLDHALTELRTAWGTAADVGTADGRGATIRHAIAAMGGIDVLINNAGAVRAGRLERITESEIEAMISVDLLAPILLTRAALPHLRMSGSGMVVNVSSGIALVGAPFYAAYAGAKAGLARFGEALRRELAGEGIHVLTAYPGATDTPMMRSNRAGPELGFSRETPVAVAEAIVAGMERGDLEVIRGGDARSKLIALNRDDPRAVDERFEALKANLEVAVSDHTAL